jgi:glycyl-tRNA synthetase
VKIDELFALLRRRGFLWPSAELYGGAAGLYDYGPLGHALKRRIEEAWSAWFLGLSEDYYRIEPAEILPEAVVRASGHLENFTDPEVTCQSCHAAFRAETVLEKWRPAGVDGLSAEQIGALLREHEVRCPNCGKPTLGVPRPFNLMFSVPFGVTGEERAYLEPETAQASFLAFPRMWDVGRRALPLGIAAIGRAYRNEIAPRQVLFRMRAFTQAELQIFFDPESFSVPVDRVADEKLPILRAERRARGEESAEAVAVRDLVGGGELPAFYVFHLAHTLRFFRDVLGYPAETLRLLEKSAQERAFYNRIQFDVEVFQESLGGFREVGAVHYRGDYDLGRHAQGSGKDLSVHLDGGKRLLPHVLELTFGVDRNLWALADRGLHRQGDRTVWTIPAYLAPVSVGVFPHLTKEHAEAARSLAGRLRADGFRVAYDESGSIGRRYARMDEVGTPFCLTVDRETLEPGGAHANTVTVRDRETTNQTRVAIDRLAEHLASAIRLPRPGDPGTPATTG